MLPPRSAAGVVIFTKQTPVLLLLNQLHVFFSFFVFFFFCLHFLLLVPLTRRETLGEKTGITGNGNQS